MTLAQSTYNSTKREARLNRGNHYRDSQNRFITEILCAGKQPHPL